MLPSCPHVVVLPLYLQEQKALHWAKIGNDRPQTPALPHLERLSFSQPDEARPTT